MWDRCFLPNRGLRFDQHPTSGSDVLASLPVYPPQDGSQLFSYDSDQDYPDPDDRGGNDSYTDTMVSETVNSNLIYSDSKGSHVIDLNTINPKRAIDDLLDVYERLDTQRKLARLASDTENHCGTLLRNLAIKGVVTSRVKKFDSLKQKLNELARENDFKLSYYLKKDICRYKDMGDFAGVRIGLYLPDDLGRVMDALGEQFHIAHLFGTVTGGRAPTRDRNKDVYKHNQGRWFSKAHDGTDEPWHFPGYKSWQVVIQHDDMAPIVGTAPPRVEIQIGTIVSQAWAEVQHNFIYKNHDNIVATKTMKRMVDAINGLSLTTEIMLEELERCLEVAKVEAQETEFKDGYAVLKWFDSTYRSKMSRSESDRWVNTPWIAHLLVVICRRQRSSEELPLARPKEFGSLIQRERLLEWLGPPKLDISVLMLNAIGWIHALDRCKPIHTTSEAIIRSLWDKFYEYHGINIPEEYKPQFNFGHHSPYRGPKAVHYM